METRLGSCELRSIKNFLIEFHVFSVDAKGRSGGLLLAWKKELNLVIKGFSEHCIYFHVIDEGSRQWRGVGLYGWPIASLKYLSWELLHHISMLDSTPLLAFGDFNEIVYSFEKDGGRPKDQQLMDAFRECLDKCQLRDLSYIGSPFTWSNGRSNNDFVQERLDRAVCTDSWLDFFPAAYVNHLNRVCSDHSPILIVCEELTNGVRKQKRRFHFEKMWVRELACGEIIQRSWCLDASDSVLGKISRCALNLGKWNKDQFGHLGRKIKELNEDLREVQTASVSVLTQEKEKRIRDELNEALLRQEVMWKQRSRILWLREGDQNSKFFHTKATSRRRTNYIRELEDKDGIIRRGDSAIEHIVLEYYTELFKTSNPLLDDFPFDVIDHHLSSEQRNKLIEPFTPDEVTMALKQMHPDKAPGPDGMPAFFYQNYWSIIGSDIQSFVLEILNSGRMPDQLNQTLVCLIPKKKKPVNLQDLRPISLCNVLYKLVSKVLANRLKVVLDSIISPVQSAFVKGRQITDNFLIAFELFHTMKCRSSGKVGNFALKLDMSKAYDRVEWVFLERVLMQMGFPPKFVALILMCLTTVTFSFLINGQTTGVIRPTRGLRQGDPISPYLFLICAEALSALTRQAERNNWIHGLKASKHGPSITHLFFADDSLFFARANPEECVRLQNLLHCYEKASGQQINYKKIDILFSRTVPNERRQLICQTLLVKEVERLPLYLGMPTVVSRSKKEVFSYVRDRVLKKMHGWKERQLSQAGKEVLIKAVVQAIPQYVMTTFALPASLCLEIQKLIRLFWWGYKEGDRGMCWIKWNNLCRPKREGGIGFRWLESFNLAFLAKQGWRLIDQPESLCSRVLKAKYFPDRHFLQASTGTRPSFTWRSILRGRTVLLKGICWRVGNGRKINIWTDNWIANQNYMKPLVKSHVLPSETVDCLIDTRSGSWRRDRIEAAFLPSEVISILKIPLSLRLPDDRLFWKFTKNGIFSVKTGYFVAEEMRRRSESSCSIPTSSKKLWRIVWSARLPPKVKIFIWRLLHNALPCFNNLFGRGLDVNDCCYHCGAIGETLEHIMVVCPFAKSVWKLFDSQIRVDKMFFKDFAGWYLGVHAIVDSEFFLQFQLICWLLWFNRNSVVHGSDIFTAQWVVEKARTTFVEFYSCFDAPTDDMLVSFGSNVAHPMLCNNGKKWKPPEPELYKLNCDAGVRNEGEFCSAGVVIRNYLGLPLVSACYSRLSSSSVEMAEGMAVLVALQLALDCGINKVVVESDSLRLISILRSASSPRCGLGLICDDIYSLLPRFSHITFTHVNREANSLAHALAQFAFSLDEGRVFMECVPDVCFDILCNDFPSS